MSNMFVFCVRSVFIFWIQFFMFKYRADSYEMEQKSSLVFIVHTNVSMSQNWNKIQHYVKLIANEFETQHSGIIEEYRIIQGD